MNSSLSCVVVGDANVDRVADLSSAWLDPMESPCFHTRLHTTVGGNAVFFAEAALDAGFKRVKMACSTGDDPDGALIRLHLDTLGVQVLHVRSDQPTGQTLILYQPEDCRVLVADRGANRELGALELLLSDEQAAPSSLLYLSGYTMLNHEERAAVGRLACTAREAGTKVLVDVVPHDIWHKRRWHDYVDHCFGAHIAAIELRTVAGFMGLPTEEVQVGQVTSFLLQHFEGSIVRLNERSDFVIACRHGQRVVMIPYARDRASLRFTDRVIAHVMRQYLADPHALFKSDEWLVPLGGKALQGAEIGHEPVRGMD